MRKLTLLRHAKSSWADPAKADIDRPLTSRGRRDAIKIGVFLAEHRLFPDFILCSTSRRTVETLAQIKPFLPDGVEIEMDRAVYSAGQGSGLIALLKSATIDDAHVMIIGHNPTMQQLALSLASPTDPGYERIEQKYPTAGLTHIEFDIDDWHKLSGRGRLKHFITPKMLAGADMETD